MCLAKNQRWKAIIYGAAKNQHTEGYRQYRKPLQSWAVRLWAFLVQLFSAETQRLWWIPYTCGCMVWVTQIHICWGSVLQIGFNVTASITLPGMNDPVWIGQTYPSEWDSVLCADPGDVFPYQLWHANDMKKTARCSRKQKAKNNTKTITSWTMKKTTLLLSAALSFMSLSTMAQDNPATLPPSLSAIYPSLAYVNDEGQCGADAVVPMGWQTVDCHTKQHIFKCPWRTTVIRQQDNHTRNRNTRCWAERKISLFSIVL